MRAELLRLAAPTLVAQMAIMLNSVIDTVMAGQLSAVDQAAVGLGSSIYISVYLAFTGVILALSPIAAQHYGARRYLEIGIEFRQTVLLAAMLSIPAIGLLLATPLWAALAKPPPEVARVTAHYLDAIALAVPANLMFRVYSALNNAISRPRMVMFINLFALLCKIPLNAALMYGFSFQLLGVQWQIPAYGGAGCAISTCITFWGMLLIGIVLLRSSDYRQFDLWKSFAPDWPRLRHLAKVGIPIGLAYLVEITSFTFIALFLARTGAVVMASHQIVSNVVGVMYMLPLALAIALSTLTAQAVGAGSRTRARLAIRQGFQIILGCALAMCLVVMLAREPIAAFYSKDPQVVQLAAVLLVWIAIYHLFDASQTALAHTLRAFKITTEPMVVYVLALWGVGLGAGYFLAFVLRHPGLPPAQSFWAAGIAANLLAAIGLWWIGAKKVRAIIAKLRD